MISVQGVRCEDPWTMPVFECRFCTGCSAQRCQPFRAQQRGCLRSRNKRSLASHFLRCDRLICSVMQASNEPVCGMESSESWHGRQRRTVVLSGLSVLGGVRGALQTSSNSALCRLTMPRSRRVIASASVSNSACCDGDSCMAACAEHERALTFPPWSNLLTMLADRKWLCEQMMLCSQAHKPAQSGPLISASLGTRVARCRMKGGTRSMRP